MAQFAHARLLPTVERAPHLVAASRAGRRGRGGLEGARRIDGAGDGLAVRVPTPKRACPQERSSVRLGASEPRATAQIPLTRRAAGASALRACGTVRRLRAWVDLAHSLVTEDIRSRAQTLARQQMAPNEAIMAADDSAFALAFGLLTPAEAALRGAARMTECFDRYLLLELGQALCMTGQPEAAARVLGALAHRFAQVDPSGRVAAAREAHASVCADPRARHFERELFTHWATTACRIDPSGSADEPVWSLAVRRGLWRSRLQRPMDHYDRSLSKRPFWEASTLPAARALEAAFPHILTECEALLQRRDERFAKYHSRVVQTGDWSDMQLFAGCKRDAAHCALCPRTAAVIEGQPRLNGVIYGRCTAQASWRADRRRPACLGLFDGAAAGCWVLAAEAL